MGFDLFGWIVIIGVIVMVGAVVGFVIWYIRN
jgi:hypothetical protein